MVKASRYIKKVGKFSAAISKVMISLDKPDRPICEELHLKEGEVLTVDLDGSKIVLEKMTPR